MDRSVSILVHGVAKTGKSTFASTSPKPLLYLDAEGGVKFLPVEGKVWDPKDPPPEPGPDWDTAIIRIRNFQDVLRAYDWLKSGKHPFNSVVLDSASEIQQLLVDRIAGRDQMTERNWGELLRTFTGLMRDFRDLADHPTKPLEAVVLVAMTKTGQDGISRPWFQGSTQTLIPYLFDMCVATDVTISDDNTGSMEHRLLIGPNYRFETGERVGGKLPPMMINPNVETILDLIFNAKKPEKSEPKATTSGASTGPAIPKTSAAVTNKENA